MRAILLATAATALLAGTAHAGVQIATFGQTSNSNTVTATVNAGDTQTTISIVNAVTDLTQFLGGPLNGVDFNMTATSTDAAQTLGTSVLQHYNGTFCLSTGINCTGTDLLSGTFTDAALGGLGGPGLVVNVNNPPDTLNLVSGVLPASELAPPSAFGVTFTSLTPGLSILGSTIAPFTAAFSGDVSASPLAVPEPMSAALIGAGLLGIGMIQRKKPV